MYGKPNPSGVDLATEMATGVKTGFLAVDPPGQTQHIDQASAYFSVTKAWGQDTFDAIRSAIVQQNCPLVAGLLWYDSFTQTQQGIVPEVFTSPLGYHAVKIAGFKQINGVDYLVIQNSWGTGYGDNGLFYFSRALSNEVFNQGIYFWSDNPDVQVKRLGLVEALLLNVYNLLTRLVYGAIDAIQKTQSTIK